MAYYAKINKETKEILNYEESTNEIVKIKTRAEKPATKVGFDFVEKVKQESDGTYITEWVEVERELTEQEKILQELAGIKQATTDNTTAIAEIIGNEIGATAEGGEVV